jgi:cytochrome bd-type quinol oxidase subunit 2
MSFTTVVFCIFLLGCCLFATLKGGRTGLIGSLIFIISAVLSQFAVIEHANEAGDIHWQGVNIGLFLVDMACFIGLLILAINSRRYWPIWAIGLQLVGVTTHIALLLAPDIVPKAYQAMASFWAIPILVIMVIGTRLDSIADRNGDIGAGINFSAG